MNIRVGGLVPIPFESWPPVRASLDKALGGSLPTEFSPRGLININISSARYIITNINEYVTHLLLSPVEAWGKCHSLVFTDVTTKKLLGWGMSNLMPLTLLDCSPPLALSIKSWPQAKHRQNTANTTHPVELAWMKQPVVSNPSALQKTNSNAWNWLPAGHQTHWQQN